MRRAKTKKSVQEQLAEAYRAEQLVRYGQEFRQAYRYYAALEKLDPRVAKAVVRVFGSVEFGMTWLTNPSAELPGVPIAMAAAPEGANKVLSVLHRLGRKMNKPLKRGEATVQQRLAEAYVGQIDRCIGVLREAALKGPRGLPELLKLEPNVAKAAAKAFGGGAGAVSWLTEPAHGLAGRVPLEVAKTRDGAAEVVRLIHRIQRNVAM